MLLADLVATSAAVAADRSRLTKRRLLAEALTRADATTEVEVVASFLSGRIRQRRTGVGWRTLGALPQPAGHATLTPAEVDAALAHMASLSGPGSQAARGAEVAALFGRATEAEQRFLGGLISGEVRQGALDALLLDAIAEAAGVPVTAVRRAARFSALSGPIAAAALQGGTAALADFHLEVGRPVRPMLASSAPDVASAVAGLSGAGQQVAVDGKIDGIRVQLHKAGDEVTVFTRSLDDITERVPEIVRFVRGLGAGAAVLDGEAISLGPDGRPLAFQDTGSVPLTTYLFDVLHLDGVDLMDAPAAERFAALAGAVPAESLVPRVVTSDAEAAMGFFTEILARGHEGVVVKDLAAPYDAGRRGSAWVKVKPRHTLDLVVLAVEWGSGRRKGWLSNIHLGARDGDGFVMLGKTFKGMTDQMLEWQTKRFLELETGRDGYVVQVRPEQVVEVAFDGVQRSPRYPGGMALRFARVLRYRDDKGPDEADTIDTVREIAARQRGPERRE